LPTDPLFLPTTLGYMLDSDAISQDLKSQPKRASAIETNRQTRAGTCGISYSHSAQLQPAHEREAGLSSLQ